MAYFSYHALDESGAEKVGTIIAKSESEAVSKLKKKKLYLTQIYQIGSDVPKQKKERQSFGFLLKLFTKKVKANEKVKFIRDLSVLVESGVSLIRALQILKAQTTHPVMKEITSELLKDVEAGQTLTDSFLKFPHVFPELYISLIRAGEIGGGQVLSDVLIRLADLCEKSERLRSKIVSALTYPAFVLGFALLVVVAMVTFILPKFFVIYQDFDLELPPLTNMLILVSTVMKENWPAFIAIFFLLYLALIFVLKKPSVRYQWDKNKLKLPVFGELFSKVAISRFARTFGTLLNSGVPILQSLDTVKTTTGNTCFEASLAVAKNSIREGEGIAAPLAQFDIFPPMVTSMIAIGEETGRVGDMLIKISNKYDDDIENTISQLTSLLEPFLIITLGLIVGVIIIALFLPLINLIQNLSI